MPPPAVAETRSNLTPVQARHHLAVLVLDESPGLAAEIGRLLAEELHTEPQVHRVETHAELEQALRDETPDLVISDYTLGEYDGFAALGLVRRHAPDTPFIFLTDHLGEEAAVEALKRGATDLVLKDHLARVAPAVDRALREAEERRRHHVAETELRDSRDQLRALTAYLQYVREEERTRIAREVHDELGQMLTNLKIELSWLTSRLPKNRRLLREKARLMLGHIDALVHTIRQIVTELRPGILDDLGLVAALEWQAEEFQRRTGMRCTFTADVPERRWDDDMTTAFFRIFQETLTNVLRHAQATKVDVHLYPDGPHLVLEVADNGRGITPEEVSNTRSIGLLGMRERAALLGGEIAFSGAPGHGTTVVIRIPIPQGPQTDEAPNEDSADRRSRDRAPRIETDPTHRIP